MNAFTIKDLELLSGIKAHTIRIWEQRYTFIKPQRTETNIRYYTNDELKVILNIALLNKYGFKISHIDRMSDAEMRDKILSLSQVEAQQERLLNELIHYMVDVKMDEFEEAIDKYISIKGIEKTITNIIFPFLERIGILWQTNHVNPAQEHLVTNIIRQKLIIGIENINTHIYTDKSIILFLPEGEHHELGLLFMSYLLKSRGVHVLYLGANIPLKDVEFLAKLKKPSFLYCHLTAVAHNFNFDKFLLNAGAKLANYKIVVSGQLTQSYKKKIPANITFKKTLGEVMEYIASL